jgi:hypothetical protein
MLRKPETLLSALSGPMQNDQRKQKQPISWQQPPHNHMGLISPMKVDATP